MKLNFLILLISATQAAYTLYNGVIYPENDPELKAYPKAGTIMSMNFSTLQKAKDAYLQYVLKTINAIELPDIVAGNAYLGSNSFWIEESTTDSFLFPMYANNGVQFGGSLIKAGFHS